MGTTHRQRSGGGIVSTLIIVLLLAVTVGLYLQIIMVEQPELAVNSAETPPQVSMQVLEGDELPASAITQPLPADQMQVIMQVFAPETSAN